MIYILSQNIAVNNVHFASVHIWLDSIKSEVLFKVHCFVNCDYGINRIGKHTHMHTQTHMYAHVHTTHTLYSIPGQQLFQFHWRLPKS